MTYAIIGTGGIGGFYGGLLAKTGKDVHFLLHTDYEYVKKHGLQVNSCNGSYHLDDLNVYNDTRSMPKCDVVMVCLKTTANHQLRVMLPPLLHKDTIVILIQNGIGVEEDLRHLLPNVQLACGIAFICTTKMEPGLVEHTSNGRLTVGNYSCRDNKMLGKVVADMASAGIKVRTADYLETRWKKCVWNMPFNGMTTVLNTDAPSLLRNEATRPLIEALMAEVVGAAKACGVDNIDMDFADKMVDMTLKMPAYSSSMQVDHEHGRQMEVGYLYTRPIEEARSHGFAMPLMSMLEAMLRYL